MGALLPGLVAATSLGVVASAIGYREPVLGAPVLAVVAGALLSPLLRRRDHAFSPGLSLARSRLLQLAVVLLGAQLSLREVASTGLSSLPVLLGTLAVCLGLAYVLGSKLLGIERDLTTLIGVGTAVCGASAIAAVTPAIKARTGDVAYAISTIFLFNVAAVIVFPPLGHAFGLSQNDFGLFAGTAVNDTSSVVAAASSYGTVASQHAVVVKLVRTLTIIPIVLTLTVLARRWNPDPVAGAQTPATATTGLVLARLRAAAGLVPGFLVAFIVVVGLNSASVIPASVQPTVKNLSSLLIAVALAAIGLSTDVAGLRRTGPRPLLLGLLLWISVAATSLLLQAL